MSVNGPPGSSLFSFPKRLQMTNVDTSVTAQHIRSIFQHFGVTVANCERLFAPPIIHQVVSDGSSGPANAETLRVAQVPLETLVVEFENGADAALALRVLDGGYVNGRCVRLQPILEPIMAEQ